MEHDRISIDPKVMVGKPCIKGTRIPVDLILRRLASGHSQEEVMEDFAIEKEDIMAAQAFAREHAALDRRPAEPLG